MAPYVWNPSLSLLDGLALVAYPLVDVLLLAVLVRFVFAPNTLTPAYYLLVLSLATMLACDAAFAATGVAGTFESGDLVDVGYLLSYVLMGSAALHQSMVTLSEPVPDREAKFSRKGLALLVGVSLIAQTVIVIQAARGERIDVPIIVGGAIVLFSLVVARIWNLLRALMTALDEHKRSEEALRESEKRL